MYLGSGHVTRLLAFDSPMAFYTSNCWFVDSEGGLARTEVCAGADRAADFNDVSQGALSMRVEALPPLDTAAVAKTHPGGDFETPTKDGPVTITGALGERVILQSTDGATFYFDVPARQFVPSLAATVTPPPSATSPVSPLATGTPAP